MRRASDTRIFRTPHFVAAGSDEDARGPGLPLSRRIPVRLLLVLAAVGAIAPRSADTDGAQAACIATQAQRYQDRYEVPGLSLAIARHGRLRHVAAYGVADANAERAEPLTADHRFRIASLSKPITALATLRLIDAGRLRLNERLFGVDGVLGARYPVPAHNPALARVTVRHLLEHSAGFDTTGPDPMFAYAGEETPDALVRWVLDTHPLVDRPGRRHRYSNFGYFLLGRVIEQRSGQHYEIYVRDTLLRPAGAARMRVGRNGEAGRLPDEVRYAGARAYTVVKPARLEAHGGWVATPSELLRLFAYVRGETVAPAPLRTTTWRRMLRPSAPPDPQGRPVHYGLGWEITARGYGHLGAMPGTLALLLQRRDGIAYAALTNRLPPDDVDGDALQAMLEAAADCLCDGDREAR